MKINDILQESQGVAEDINREVKITFTPDDIEVVERAAEIMPAVKILPNIINQYEKIAGIDREGNATLTLDLSADDISNIELLIKKYGRKLDETGVFYHIIDEIDRQGVSEGHADQQRTIIKRNGQPVGEIGIDRESSPGVGQYYMKHYASGTDNSGYDSREEALGDLRHIMKQSVYGELQGQGVRAGQKR